MLGPSQQQTVIEKLGRVEQQVQRIRSMIQEPAVCAGILQRLAEAESSLNNVSLTILQMHVRTCVPAGVETSDEEGRNRLSELVDIFDRFAR